MKQTCVNGNEASFTYDNQGRTKTVTHKDGPTLPYAFTGDGMVHSITESVNGVTTVMYLQQHTPPRKISLVKCPLSSRQ